MQLQEALKYISPTKYYRICGLSYHYLEQYNHQHLTYSQLPPAMKGGIILLIHGIFRVQKMVNSYELTYVIHCMMDCGIKPKEFLIACDISRTFYKTKSLSTNREEKLVKIRMQLLGILNTLFEYMLHEKATPKGGLKTG